MLSKNQLLANNKIILVKDTIPFVDRKQISSITEYIIRVHGIEEFQPFFSQNLDSLIRSKESRFRMSDYDKTTLLSLVNLTYVWNLDIEGSAVTK